MVVNKNAGSETPIAKYDHGHKPIPNLQNHVSIIKISSLLLQAMEQSIRMDELVLQ
jgi:hypothetical protein